MNIKIDSRKVVKGDTFIALRGKNTDGHLYIEEAIDNGAEKIICERIYINNVECQVVPDSYEYLKDYLVNNYSDIINKLNIVGITGTNGKTTTSYLTYQIMNELGYKCAYIGTLGFYLDKFVRDLNNTTPDILELYNILLEIIDNNYDYVVMEVSSHSLDFERIKGIKFKSVAITNLTQDHLDHHINMNNYLNAKLKIFDYLDDDSFVLVNSDDEYCHYFEYGNYFTIGCKDSRYQIVEYKNTESGTYIKFKVDKLYEVETNLKNKYNIYNYLFAVAVVHLLNIEIDKIIDVSINIMAPPGRCQIIKYNTNQIVIDYAHTPDAVSKIIDSFNEIKEGKIITIIGCGGDRDNKKRPIMGKIASNNSDYVILTNDNPRTEDEINIMNDIVSGIDNNNYEIIYDRKLAIIKGVSLLKDKDILLILGKGHEDYQILGYNKIHFSDIEETMKIIDLNDTGLN